MYTKNEEFTAPTQDAAPHSVTLVEPAVERAASRNTTLDSRWQAVERAIRMMRERYPEPLSLEEIAKSAYFSRFHFNRFFRQITGLSPVRFLAAIRLEVAKRLLLTTHFSVTTICFEVGYNSVGTFTSHFTRYVGIQPHRLRRLPHQSLGRNLALAKRRGMAAAGEARRGHELTVHLTAPADSVGPIFIGIFSTPIPRGRPLSCAVADGPGEVSLAPVPDEPSHVFAIRLPVSDDPMTVLLCEGAPRGRARLPPSARDSGTARGIELALRPPRVMDPPVLVALPCLLA